MARRLPWKTGQRTSRAVRSTPESDGRAASPEQPSPVAATASPRPTPPPRPRPLAPSPAQRRRASAEKPSSPVDSCPDTPPRRPRPGLPEPPRSPSTSPPPEPPPEQPMIASDDRYRMVEDEFLLTAQRFTTHLHRAEYNRLKARAATYHAVAIRAIERPVVGPPTRAARLRAAAAKRAARQQTLLTPRAALDDADADAPAPDAPWVGTALQGLMDTPRAEHRHLSSACPPIIGAPERVAASSTPERQSSPRPPPTRRRLPAATVDRATSSSRDCSPAVVVVAARDRASRGQLDSDHEESDDDDPFSINRRRMRRQKARAKLRNKGNGDHQTKLSPDTIPSFL